MSCTGTADCVCGCCAGTSVQTPQVETNPPGQSSLSYRAGTWATFKESMLARLSSSDYPALARLKTRDDDDFTIAFLDATAVVLDILTFYQERLANESYLGTATQQRSLTELARLIGYQPSPGVSASVYVAFTLQAAPGQPPDPTAPAITIPKGTQVQSVPAQGQKPQVFETSADIQAKADWNALPVRSAQPWIPASGDQYVYLQGTATQLQPGDLVLIVGDERAEPDNPGDPHWDIRLVTTVTPDTPNKRTYVEWSEGLGSGNVGPAQQHPKFYAFRQRASFFGYNAINPQMLSTDTVAALVNHIEAGANAPTPSAGAAGTGYKVGDEIEPVGIPGSGGLLQVVSTDSSGAVNAPLAVIDAGTGYNNEKNVATFGGSGTGLEVDITASISLLNSENTDWNFTEPASGLIDLDAVYSNLVVDGWIALIHPDANVTRSPAGFVSLYLIKSITSIARSAYSISAKISRAAVDTDNNLGEYYGFTRETTALVQSEELAVAPKPLIYPLYGTTIDLEDLRPDLAQATVVAITGPRQKLSLQATPDVIAGKLQFVPDDDPSNPLTLNPGDIVIVTDPTPLPPPTDANWQSSASVKLNAQDASGRPGTVQASLSDFMLAASSSSDPEVSEYAVVQSLSSTTGPDPHTQVLLQSNLVNCYDRNSTTVNANVGMATAGQSVSEIMGSGSASTPNQEFTLKQSPLTYVQAPTPTGRQSTLQVQVNGVTWNAVPTLYQQGPSQPVYATLNQSDGTTDVLFGDGVEGATLPTGQNNIQANYRVGLGSAGNVAAGAISTLIDRPLGVSGVTNPEAATGGEDPDSVDGIRTNAPQSVLTLGRAVSITDYQSYAATFAGIAKAHAIWIPYGPGRGVFLTVAGVDGAALQDSPTLTNLVTSLRNYGNPLIPINAQSFLETLFGLSADLQYDPRYDQPTVQSQVLQTLYQTYSFANRTFGQGVSADEVSTVIQAVPGVVAVNVTNLSLGPTSAGGDLAGQPGGFTLANQRNWVAQEIPTPLPRPPSGSPTRICPYVPVASTNSIPYPAEILVLNPDPTQVSLGTMS